MGRYLIKTEYINVILKVPGVTGVGHPTDESPADARKLIIYVKDEATKDIYQKLFAKEIDGLPVEVIVRSTPWAF